MIHHSILLRLNPFDVRVIGRDGGLSALCHSCGFNCQQRVLKTFPVPDFPQSEDKVVGLSHLLVNLYIQLKTFMKVFNKKETTAKTATA